ncbi:hypothetical protein BGX20_010150, partial [Mortierella sp. AD010]
MAEIHICLSANQFKRFFFDKVAKGLGLAIELSMQEVEVVIIYVLNPSMSALIFASQLTGASAATMP